MIYDCTVIGGGAAGMLAAATAAECGAEVLLLEKNPLMGRKLGLTGKGRCNLTNRCDRDEFLRNVPVNPRFMYSAVSAFSPEDTIELFEGLGVALKTERGNRVFPVSDRAGDVVMALKRYTDRSGVKTLHTAAVGVTAENGEISGVQTEQGFFQSRTVIIATGGLSYPATGSTGDGYRFAAELGHTIIEPRPSLVALESSDGFCRELAGLTLKNVALRLFENGREIYSDFGELLFTHTGISGPTVISASAHMRKKDALYRVELDLKPALTQDQLDARVLREISASPRQTLKNLLRSLLPASMCAPFCELSGVGGDTVVSVLSKAERKTVVQRLKSFPIEGLKHGPAESAIITSGGVKTSEIDPASMASKIVRGLYFAGEIIDTHAYTGGFNLQIAFSTARLAGRRAAEQTKGR